jgi:hypothetical protein
MGRWFAGLLAVSAFAQPSAELNKQLPKWIQFSGEYRVRVEGFAGSRYEHENDDGYWLNRVRFNMRLQPLSWLRFHAQAQDSHVYWNSRVADAPPLQDSMDLRLAWGEIGDSDNGRVALRVGRQEIALGEERLVGSGNWGNTARSFDAVRFTFRPLPKTRFDVFAASLVAQRDGTFDRHVDGDNLHGIMGQIDARGHHIEPFAFWRLAPRVRNEGGAFARLDSKTVGFRSAGKLTRSLEYVTEMAVQAGFWGSDEVRAWAGHWRVHFPVSTARYAPRMRLEYNYATGDSNPGDRRHETFELLYPTPHDKYGLADQVGWKNLHHIGTIGEWKVLRKWTWQLKHHAWWLASTTDGVYNAGGALLARDPSGQSGRYIGHEVDVQALAPLNKQVQFGAGLGHIFPGRFLKRTTPGAHYTFPYVMVTWSF